MKVTKEQIKRIHTLAGALGIEDDDRRADMKAMYGKNSSTELTYGQADEYIQHLERRAIEAGVWRHPNRRKVRQKYDELGHRPGMATPAQLRLIESHWAAVSWQSEPQAREAALKMFLFKHYRVGGLMMVRKGLVSKIVHTLKIMKQQNAKPERTS